MPRAGEKHEMDIAIEPQFALLLFPHEFGYQRLICIWIEINREIDDETKQENRYEGNYDQAEPEVAVHRWGQDGAGEGNRTLVVSLGSFCSAIELHPRVGQIIRRNRGLALSRYRIQPKLPPSTIVGKSPHSRLLDWCPRIIGLLIKLF